MPDHEPNQDLILVTGATGNVGREVAKALEARHRSIRRAGRGQGDGVALDFTQPSTFGPALQGVRGVFLMRPPAISKVKDTINRFVDVAARVGVQQVVFLSVVGAGRNPLVPHHAIEKHLEGSGIAWTFLRAGFFAQNLGDAYRTDIRDHDRIYVPAGAGRVNFVDTRDLAEAAAIAFERPDLRNRALTLTGPGAVTFAEIATMLTHELGRTIGYQPASVLGYLRHLRAGGLTIGHAAIQAILHVGLRFGQGATMDPTLGQLLGRPPRGVQTYIADHLERWAPGRPA